jgi:HK97 family phage major capsid protein/HK97 family phage prohead protease
VTRSTPRTAQSRWRFLLKNRSNAIGASRSSIIRPGACDLSRLNARAPLLLNHDSYDPDNQVGAVESASIDADKRGRAIAKVSRSARGQEILQDVQDGIRTSVSVGYEVHEMKLIRTEDGLDTYLVTKWTPIEISLVSIPADPTVGVNRSKQPQKQSESEMKLRQNILLDPAATATAGGGGAPAAPAATAAPAAPSSPSVTETSVRSAVVAERERVKAYREIGRQYEAPELAERAVDQEWSKDRLLAEILAARPGARQVTPAEQEQGNKIGMSRKELSKYSIVRAMHARAQGLPLTGLELEASQTVEKRVGQKPRGFFVPCDVTEETFAESKDLTTSRINDLTDMVRSIATQRALAAGVATAGGVLIGTNVMTGSMIELLRNQTLVAQLGAIFLSGLVGNCLIPKQSGGGTSVWLGEGETLTLSQQAFGQLVLVPRKLGAATEYSNELLRQTGFAVEAFVRQDLMRCNAIARDLAAIAGTGGKQPLGIINTTGIGSVTFGGAPTWGKIVDHETAIANANALAGSISWLMNASVRGKWKQTVKAANTAVYLMEGNQSNGYNANVSNQVAGGRTILANWNDLILADWDGMDVKVDPYSAALNDAARTIIFQMCDSGVRHPESFAVSTDSGAQ